MLSKSRPLGRGPKCSSRRLANEGDGFQYDLANQITGYEREGTVDTSTGAVSGAANNDTLTFDASGNRASLVDKGATTSYTRNSLNQYRTVTGSSNPTYDGNGNLKTYKDWTFGYDAMNRLISVTKGTTNTGYFWYDGLGRICTRQINGGYGVRYRVWAGWDLVEDYKMVDDTLDTRYLQGEGSDEMVSITTGGQKYYLYQDGRGNVSQVTDSNAMVIETYKYDLNGTPTIYDPSGVQDTDGISAIGNRIMFGGREYYRELQLYNFRNRFYLPELGRFLQPDPIGFAGDPANLYRYCGNNSVNESDPTGLGNKLDGTSDGTGKYIPLGSHIPVPPGQSLGNVFYFPSGYASTNGWGSVSGTPSTGGSGLSFAWTYPDGHQGPPPPMVEVDRIIVVGKPVSVLDGIIGDLTRWALGVSHDAIMFSEFASGEGPEVRVFGPRSLESRNMATDPRLRSAFNSAMATGRPQPLPFRLPQVEAAGLNPTRQFVGGYSVEGLTSNPPMALIYNRTSLRSFAAQISWVPTYDRSVFPVFGNIYQFYVVDVGGGP